MQANLAGLGHHAIDNLGALGKPTGPQTFHIAGKYA